MKKTFLIITLVLVIFCLTACDPEHYHYSYEELNDSVVKVELINYNNPNAKELFEKRNKVISFDYEKMEIIETLEFEQFDGFFSELSKILFFMSWRHSDSPKGISVRLVYENGDFEIISCHTEYSGSFDSDGNVIQFIGSGGGVSLVNLINSYFSTQVE